MTLDSSRRCLIAAAATMSLACAAGRPYAPQPRSVVGSRLVSAPALHDDSRNMALDECTNLQAPSGTKLVAHYYAKGVQVYRWSGTSWTFVAPDAVLSADAGGNSKVGTHYAGPTWESVSGSKVVGAVSQRCTPEPAAIPWLSLSVVSSDGPGIFNRVTFIQRMNTVGGIAPSSPGSAAGEEMRVPYTAQYFFYR